MIISPFRARVLSAILVLLLQLGAAGPAWPQIVGDADCDNQLGPNDLDALIGRLFDDVDCGHADPNLDSVTSAADLLREVTLLGDGPTDPTPSPTPALGPRITFFGIAGASGRLASSAETTDTGVPIFARNAQFGFKLVIEAAPGTSGAAVGQTLLVSRPGDPTAFPDLQILVNRALGNGSADVCDAGGVPGVDPPRFAADLAIANAVNDFACRFTIATTRSGTCTLDDFETMNFASSEARIQFCLQVPLSTAFPRGDTLVVARVQDRIGNVGSEARLVVRVPGGVPTETPTPTAGAPSKTPTRTRTPTRPPTETFTATHSPSPTATRTTSPTPGPPTGTSTPRPTLGATSTPSVTGTASRTPSRTATPFGPTAPPTATASRTVTPPPSRSPTRTPTRPPSATPSRSPSPSRTRSPTPTVTPTSAGGPMVSFFGLIRADDTRIDPDDHTPEGVPIYRRIIGTAFRIVVEGQPGPTRRPLGISSFQSDPNDPTVLPDLQIQVNRPLGNGSRTVCDNMPPDDGGVPAVTPPSFSATQPIADAINDFACRFVDGVGLPQGRPRQDACVRFPDGDFNFINSASTVQFCSVVIPQSIRFANGDTLVSARLRDQTGAVGPMAQIIVRIGP